MEDEEAVSRGTEAAERDRSWTTTQHGNNETWSLNEAEGLAPQPYHIRSQLLQASFPFQGCCEESSVTGLKQNKIKVQLP